MKAGSGRREAGAEKREAGSGKREAGPTPFAEVMRTEGMAAPPALQQAIANAAGESRSAEDTLRAAEELLDRVLAGECESRKSALDLLTVDALITRAMAIAAGDPEMLGKFPELAMKRIAAR